MECKFKTIISKCNLIINLSIPSCQRLIYYIILCYQDNHGYPQISDLQKLHKDKQYIYIYDATIIFVFFLF